jgi:DivIVA domain-containing protein
MLKSSEISSVRFQPTKFREGYSMAGVDDFLAHVRLSLEACEQRTAPALSSNDVVNVRFQPTKFRAGYDQDEVDNFLDTVTETLQSYGY